MIKLEAGLILAKWRYSFPLNAWGGGARIGYHVQWLGISVKDPGVVNITLKTRKQS